MADSIFEKKSIGDVYEEIQKQYLSDNRPWIIGFRPWMIGFRPCTIRSWVCETELDFVPSLDL